MVLKARLLLGIVALVCFCGCSNDEATSTYSQREYVFCRFNVLQYTELFHVMGTPGQFASIRKHIVNGVTKVTMTSANSSTDYMVDALSKNFGFGLGGLIVGTNYFSETLCYDLACPICDRTDRRLTLSGDGYAHCAKCGTTYDMNNYGVIYQIDEDNPPLTKRGLYRYHITYNGEDIYVYN